jgi:hypothetical protein
MLVFSFSVEAFYQRHWWLLFALTACVSALAAGGEGARGATADLADRPV